MNEIIDEPTRNLSNYVKEKGINVSNMAKKTGLSYEALRSSLLKESVTRNLRAYEYFKICDFLNINPRDYVGELMSK